MMRERGVVSSHWRDSYGFLRPDGQETDLFVHVSALEGFDALPFGARVSFERSQDRRGRPCAVSVRVEA